AADRAVAGPAAAMAPLEGTVVCPLSGGRDSRILFVALAREGRIASAATVSDDEGDTHEEALAAPVAEALGVPHQRLEASVDDYPFDWERRARLGEHQFVDHAWLMPLVQRIAGIPAPVPDGFGIDVFFCAGRHFYTPETLDTRDGARAGRALFDTLRRYGRGERALDERLRGAIESSAREQ